MSMAREPREAQAAGGSEPAPRRKDAWDKADVVLKPLGGLLTAAIIALLGFWTQEYLRERAEQDTRVRLYNQLLSEREKAESQLRSTMFAKIIDSFVGAGESPAATDQLLYLELLVHNFHESLNLAPLFSHLQRQIHASEGKSGALSERLSDLAREVGRKQLMALVPHGHMHESVFFFEKTRTEAHGEPAVQVVPVDGPLPEGGAGDPKYVGETLLVLGDGARQREVRVRLFLEDVDQQNLRLKVRAEVEDELLAGQSPPEFWLDYFDFPMIDNTRLSGGHRLALVLTDFDATGQGDVVQGAARLAVVAFPEEYASLKDRTFLQDVLDELTPAAR